MASELVKLIKTFNSKLLFQQTLYILTGLPYFMNIFCPK